MEHSLWNRNAGLGAFFLSGICAISTGIIVSLLQEEYGFDYSITGTLLSFMNIGNLIAGFAAGILPGRIGQKRSTLLLTFGYTIGYLLMGLSGTTVLLMLGFFLLGVAKGSTLNTCTLLVSNNSKSRTTGMNLMHSCYALGALLCPFIIAAAANAGFAAPLIFLALCGFGLWSIFLTAPISGRNNVGNSGTELTFLRSKRFWLLTGLLFCQNASETSVTSWMVAYFKGSGIIAGAMSAYTVTVMWGATLIARLIIVFVIPVKRPAKSLIVMASGCIIFYAALIQANAQLPAILLLFAFAFSMAGMNPTAVSLAGRMSTAASLGVMLPFAASGAIIMPWLIGIVAEYAGISTGMAVNIAPCAGLLVFSILVARLPAEQS